MASRLPASKGFANDQPRGNRIDALRRDTRQVSFAATLIMTLLSLALILYIVVSNWGDYRASLLPHRFRRLVK